MDADLHSKERILGPEGDRTNKIFEEAFDGCLAEKHYPLLSYTGSDYDESWIDGTAANGNGRFVKRSKS